MGFKQIRIVIKFFKYSKKIKMNRLISNYFELNLLNQDIDINCCIYYISSNKCSIIIRRLDSDKGWDNEIKIEIFDEKNSEEIIIPLSKKNHFEIKIQCQKIELNKKKDQEQKIPKTIIQTFFTKETLSVHHQNAQLSFIEFNPEYEYKLFLDYECREFISNHFPKYIVKVYDLLYSLAYKSDLFRLCYLFVKGGCYFDNKHILKCPLSDIIDPNDKDIFCDESFEFGIHCGLLFSIPNNYCFKLAILDICEKVSRRYIPTHILELAGPIQVYKFLKMVM